MTAYQKMLKKHYGLDGYEAWLSKKKLQVWEEKHPDVVRAFWTASRLRIVKIRKRQLLKTARAFQTKKRSKKLQNNLLSAALLYAYANGRLRALEKQRTPIHA